MLNLDGGEPEPERGKVAASDMSDFEQEARRFHKRRKERERHGTPRHVMAYVIGAVLLAGFLIAACEAMGPQACATPKPEPSGPEP
jgi:5-formaminoimidazole-4-carboxamide-1-beta-D-ribofuranosyl 5'-monophosphate synthetase